MEFNSILKLASNERRRYDFSCRQHLLRLGETTKVMGILNVSSDSFSRDGIYKDVKRAKDYAVEMVSAGAEIVDVGGESTRPNAQPVSEQEEIDRVIPVVRELFKVIKVPISVDTTKSEVARAALSEGSSIVNDISGLRFDHKMAGVILEFEAGCILVHIRGTPQTMQRNPVYESLIEEIIENLKQSVSTATSFGIERSRIVIDPGIGFGKTTEHNLRIIKNLRDFSCLNLPLLIGTSRKSFIGNILGLELGERLLGTAATVAAAIFNGAHIVRVHDVREMVQVVKIVDAILNS